MRIRSPRSRKTASQNFKKRSLLKQALIFTSMLDIMMTILFYLLKNFSYTVTNFNLSKDLKLPQSTSKAPPPESSLNLVVTQKAIFLDNEKLVPIVEGKIPIKYLYQGDRTTITLLYQKLQQHKKRSLYISKHNNDHSFTGTIVLQADESLPYSTLKKVIYTAGVTDFVRLKLAVLKKDDL